MNIYIKNLGAEHSLVASGHLNLATVYDAQSNNEKALENYNLALTIKIKAEGDRTAEIAGIYNSIGMIYKNY